MPRVPPTHYVYLSSTVGASHRTWSRTYHARCTLRISRLFPRLPRIISRPPCGGPTLLTFIPHHLLKPYPFLMQDGRRDAPHVGATSLPARSPGTCLTFVASPEHCTPDSGQAAPHLSSSMPGSPSRLMHRGLYTKTRPNACSRRTCAR